MKSAIFRKITALFLSLSLMGACFVFSSCTPSEVVSSSVSGTESVSAGVSSTEEPTEEKTVWDYTIDDLANYLARCGDIKNDDFVNLASLASVTRSYHNVEILWWDLENMSENSEEYKRWKEYEENGFAYLSYAGGLYFLTNNGPFGIHALDSYAGDVQKLYSDFLLFPSGYTKTEIVSPPIDYSRDKSVVYNNYNLLVQSYPDASYEYENDPVELPSAYSLRDDYMIYTQSQGVQGLCWSFAGSTALSTTLMKAKGEYLDFSEGWISLALAYQTAHKNLPNYTNNLSSSYLYGDAGGVLGFDLVASESGVVLEQDFGYDESYLVSQENLDDYYEYYSQFSNKEIMNEVSLVHFSDYAIRNKGETIKNSMKRQILTGGSIISWTLTTAWATAEYNGETVTYKNPDTSGAGDHIISIIGWDDDFSLEINGKTHTGAWIVLNSWGQTAQKDGVMYIFYDDGGYKNEDSHFFAYRYLGNTAEGLSFSDTILQSNAAYTTSLKGAYYGDFTTSESRTQQKNIFFDRDDISLTYSYTLSYGAKIDDIRIYSEGRDVTASFTIGLDENERTYTVTGVNVEHGEYKTVIYYSDGAQSKRYYNCFFLCDGTELNYVLLSGRESDNGVKNNPYYTSLYYTYGNGERTLVYYTDKTSGRISYQFHLATYSEISDFSSPSAAVTFSSYSSQVWSATVSYDLSLSSEYPIVMTTGGGVQKTVTVKIVQTDASLLTSVAYTVDGGESVNVKVAVTAAGAVIEEPAREGYTFVGWYYDIALNEPLEKDGEGNYILTADGVRSLENPTNYLGNSVASYAKFSYVFLYAKWEKT